MARLKSNKPPHKKVHTDRVRAPGTKVEVWTNNKAALIGLLLGQGYSSVDIAKVTRDSPETIRSMVKKWQLHRYDIKRGVIVPLSYQKRRLAEEQAAALHVPIGEYLKRICECTIGDGLYQAVTDGRYAT